MSFRIIFAIFLFCFPSWMHGKEEHRGKVHYSLIHDPIDVVIACHDKDKKTLDLCIEGIKENCKNIGRVIIISAKPLTDKAEWFNETAFPFTKKEVALVIARGDKKEAQKFSRHKGRGPGWYFQQLLKLYAPFVIPDISSNVLVIDADTIFMNPTEFLNESGGGLFCVSSEQPQERYLKHAKRLVPSYKRIYPEYYSVCHHMLFQKAILKDLFHTVEKYHDTSFWKAFCSCVDFEGEQGASEYEIYYNYALRHTDQVQIRGLKWTNSAHLDEKDLFKKAGYHFVAFHTYMRGKWPRTFGENPP
jgi:hypothetical protein